MHGMRAWQLTLLQYLDQSYVFTLECSSALDLEITEYSYVLVSSRWDSKILLCHLLCFSLHITLAFLYRQCLGCSQFQTMAVSGIIHSPLSILLTGMWKVNVSWDLTCRSSPFAS